jgi:hypothetical protein
MAPRAVTSRPVNLNDADSRVTTCVRLQAESIGSEGMRKREHVDPEIAAYGRHLE